MASLAVLNPQRGAGVGTAISREAMDFMAHRSHNQIFDVTSLTEDYMFGLRLSQ